MKRLIKIALWSIASLMTLLTMGLGAIVFWLYLLEIDNAAPGSFAYIVGIPDYAKNVPLLKPCAPPLYSYRAEDGTKAETVEIRFSTSAFPKETIAYFKAFMEPRGCLLSIDKTGTSLGTIGVCEAQDIWYFNIQQNPSDTGCFPVTINLSGNE